MSGDEMDIDERHEHISIRKMNERRHHMMGRHFRGMMGDEVSPISLKLIRLIFYNIWTYPWKLETSLISLVKYQLYIKECLLGKVNFIYSWIIYLLYKTFIMDSITKLWKIGECLKHWFISKIINQLIYSYRWNIWKWCIECTIEIWTKIWSLKDSIQNFIQNFHRKRYIM